MEVPQPSPAVAALDGRPQETASPDPPGRDWRHERFLQTEFPPFAHAYFNKGADQPNAKVNRQSARHPKRAKVASTVIYT